MANNKYISVIIPTLQKNLKVLNTLLGILCKDKVVNEILVINNFSDKFVPNMNNDKIVVLNQKANLYVNQSWNLGIEIIKNDYFLIINDDILCCRNLCTDVINSRILEKKDTGLVGISIYHIKHYDVDSDTIPIPRRKGKISFAPLSSCFYTSDWGSAFFGKKTNYYKIPMRYKILYGDNYLLRKNLENNKINYSILGYQFNHIHSLSARDEQFIPIVISDVNNFNKTFV